MVAAADDELPLPSSSRLEEPQDLDPPPHPPVTTTTTKTKPPRRERKPRHKKSGGKSKKQQQPSNQQEDAAAAAAALVETEAPSRPVSKKNLRRQQLKKKQRQPLMSLTDCLLRTAQQAAQHTSSVYIVDWSSAAAQQEQQFADVADTDEGTPFFATTTTTTTTVDPAPNNGSDEQQASPKRIQVVTSCLPFPPIQQQQPATVTPTPTKDDEGGGDDIDTRIRSSSIMMPMTTRIYIKPLLVLDLNGILCHRIRRNNHNNLPSGGGPDEIRTPSPPWSAYRPTTGPRIATTPVVPRPHLDSVFGVSRPTLLSRRLDVRQGQDRPGAGPGARPATHCRPAPLCVGPAPLSSGGTTVITLVVAGHALAPFPSRLQKGSQSRLARVSAVESLQHAAPGRLARQVRGLARKCLAPAAAARTAAAALCRGRGGAMVVVVVILGGCRNNNNVRRRQCRPTAALFGTTRAALAGASSDAGMGLRGAGCGLAASAATG